MYFNSKDIYRRKKLFYIHTFINHHLLIVYLRIEEKNVRLRLTINYVFISSNYLLKLIVQIVSGKRSQFYS